MRRLVLVLVTAVAAALVIAAPASAAPSTLSNPCDGPEDGFNVIVGSRAPDVLTGTDCNDAIFGLRGADVIRGKLGYDLLRGGRGPDRITDTSFLFGGQIRGGLGQDTCVVAAGTLVQLFSCETVIELS